MLGATIFSLALVSLEITPTRVVEAFVSPRSALVKRELIIPESGEAIIAEPPTTEYHSLLISPESKSLVRDVAVALNDENPLYRVRAIPGAKVFIYANQSGLTWEGSYSAQYIHQNRMEFKASRLIINEQEDLTNVRITLFDDYYQRDLIADYGNSIGFPSPVIPTTSNVQTPNGFQGLSYNESSSYLIHPHSGRILEDIQYISREYSEESLKLDSIEHLSLKKGERHNILTVEGQFDSTQLRTYFLQSSRVTRSTKILFEDAKVTDEILMRGIPSTFLAEYSISVTKNGKEIYQGSVRESYRDSIARILTGQESKLPDEWETEVSRKRVIVNETPHDLVTMYGEILISNSELYEWEARVVKAFKGELVGQNNEVACYSRKLEKSSTNPTTAIVWTTLFKPGQSKSLKYTYQVLVEPS